MNEAIKQGRMRLMEGRAHRTNERPTSRHRYISSTQRIQSGLLAEDPEEGFTCGGSRGRYAGYTDITARCRLEYNKGYPLVGSRKQRYMQLNCGDTCE